MKRIASHLRNAATGIRMGYPCIDADLLDTAAREIERLEAWAPSIDAPPGLTPRQFDLMRFIQDSVDANGYAPNLDEMAAALNLVSRSNAHGILHGLVERGYIAKLARRPRAITILKRVQDKSEPAPKSMRILDEAWKDGGVSSFSAPPSTNSRTSCFSHGDCGRRTEDKGSDEAVLVRASDRTEANTVNSSQPADNFNRERENEPATDNQFD
jgi:DNA-binding MarR family transcriptional regulator